MNQEVFDLNPPPLGNIPMHGTFTSHNTYIVLAPVPALLKTYRQVHKASKSTNQPSNCLIKS